MLHLVVTLFNAAQQSINQQVVRFAERKTFWKTSSPPVFGANRTDSSKLSTPQPQRAGFFVFSGARFLGRFWRESRLFVTTPVFSLPQVIFDFLYPYFGNQILHCHRNGKWNQQSFCRINVVSQNWGINIPPVHRNSCHLVLFPPAACLRFYKK